jgi:hypothetical protein
MSRWLFLLIGALLSAGCAGSRQAAENPELQQWVGTWQGMALQENRNDPPRQWTLILSIHRGRLRGVMSDNLGEMRRRKLENVKIVDGELRFTVAYETSRGLHRICRHHAKLEDDILLSRFDGSEGGRALEGKWEARQVAGASTATQ